MITLKQAAAYLAAAFSVGALPQYGITAHAQNVTNTSRPPQVIPLTGTEAAAKLVIDGRRAFGAGALIQTAGSACNTPSRSQTM